MRPWQMIVLAVLALVMVVGVVLTWGSLGSTILLFCLLAMGSALLIRYFLMERNTDDFQMDV